MGRGVIILVLPIVIVMQPPALSINKAHDIRCTSRIMKMIAYLGGNGQS